MPNNDTSRVQDVERRAPRPALTGSYEALLHEVGIPRVILPPHADGVTTALSSERLERAIGVVYRPETERPPRGGRTHRSHYRA